MAGTQQITSAAVVMPSNATTFDKDATNLGNIATNNNNSTRIPIREVEMRPDEDVDMKHDGEWNLKQHSVITSKTNGWKENFNSAIKNYDLSNEALENERSEVMIYRSNKPILKVETGTSLGVLKLLYESESRVGCQILGVRPKSADGMPCIITLDESKLAEAQYDILVSDKISNGSGEKHANTPATAGDKTATTRCLECSRESWKSKKFTSTGMNTEISVNPVDDIDMRVFSSVNGGSGGGHGKSYSHITSSSPCNFSSRVTRMRSSGGNRQPICPGVIGGHNAAAMNNGTMSNGNLLTSLGPSRGEMRNSSPPNSMLGTKILLVNGDNGELSRERSPPMQVDAAMFGPQTFPRDQGLSSEPGLYDNGMHRRQSAFDDARCRSPCTSPTPVSQRNTPMPLRPPVKEEQLNDSNPTVYVLPNDFDIASGMEPQIAADYQHQQHHRAPVHHERMVPPVHVNGESVEEQEAPVGYDLPTQVRIGDMSPARDGKLGRRSPTRSNSVSPTSLIDDLGSPASQDNSPTPKLLCKICQKVFPTKSMLYKHLRGHSSDEKPYKCQECGQGFTLSSNLRQHRIIHRGYKPFQCEFCGKKFMRSNVYKQHRRIHTGEEMHKCSLCPSEFLQKYALMKHMKKQHDIDCGESV